ncbi:MAG TPA: AMP-binding protein, partial [Chthoniobacterales bacterium]
MRDLTESLRRYLEISRRPAGAAIHTSQVSISFGEQIDPAALRAGWEALARSIPELRTTFQADGNVEVGSEPSLGWTELDWDSAPPEDLGAAWQALVSTDATLAIAADSQPAVRVTFIRLPGGGGHALWTFHAGLLDEPSVSIVLRQWLHAYDCVRTGAEVPSFESAEIVETESDDSWKAAFEGLTSRHPLIVLPLPGASDDPDARRSVSHTFERPERAEFAASAERCGGTLRGLFTAAWAFVLARASTSADALVLEPARESADRIGRQETFVLRRYAVESHATSADLISACSVAMPTPPATTAIAQALGLSLADLEPSACFVYRDLPLNDRLLLDAPRWMAADVQLLSKSPGGITLRVTAGDRPEVALDYDPARLSEPAARLLLDAVTGAIRALAAAPEAGTPLAELALVGMPAEVEAPEAPRLSRSLVPQGIHELFADIAQEAPDAVAIEMGGEKLTFAQLDTGANQLARYLRKHGVEPGARVGVAMPRSPRWVTALLGILKVGATIVPLDETTREPAAKIRAWVVDVLEEGDQRALPVIQMQGDAGAIGNEKSRGVQAESALAKEAIAWTDGDTVRACSHEKLVGSFESTAALLELTPADRVLQFAPTGTFQAVEETFVTLLSGATLILREGNRWPTRTTFQEFVGESAITALSVPVPFWSQWTHYLTDLSISVPATLRVAMISDGLPS